MEARVGSAPIICSELWQMRHCRARTLQHVSAETFQSATLAEIQQLVIVLRKNERR